MYLVYSSGGKHATRKTPYLLNIKVVLAILEVKELDIKPTLFVRPLPDQIDALVIAKTRLSSYRYKYFSDIIMFVEANDQTSYRTTDVV